MAQRAPLSSPSFLVSNTPRILRIVLLQAALAATVAAQTPQQQHVFGSVPITTTTSQVAAYAKNGQTGALSAVAGSPFADSLQGGAMAIDALGRFLFVINTSTSNISMFQIDQSTGSLTQVPGSPFSTGPTENPNMAATSPVCLAAEKSGQFLYVGYRFGNFVDHGAINEYLIDASNRQLVPLSGQPTTDIASAPIGMITDPKGLHLYVGLGLNPSTGVQDAGTSVYSIDPVTGVLGLVGTAGNAISAGRSIAIDPQGRFFFDGWGAILGTIDSALISPADGTALTGISSVSSGNEIPAAMLADSSGKFLYVQQGSAPVVYAINQATGALAVPPATLAVLSFSPDSAAADPLGPYIYSLQNDGVHGFLVDPQSGNLSEISGSPFGGTAAQGALTISGTPVQAASGPVAALFPSSEDFGPVTVGQSSNSKLVTLTNTGGQALGLTSITVAGANASDFVATPNCSFPTVLAPNATCTISVVFSPTAAGPRQASLAAADNAPGSPQSIPLTGAGASPLPAVTLTPGSLTFASTTQGSTSPAQRVIVTSSGAATLHISSVFPGGANPADFQVTNACSGAYPVASTCSITVTFSPLGAGQRTANITISDDAPDSPQYCCPHNFPGCSRLDFCYRHGRANRNIQSAIDAWPRLCWQRFLRLRRGASGCHLRRSQRATRRRNTGLLCCDSGHDSEHPDRIATAGTAAPPIYLVAGVCFAGVLWGFCAASLCFQVAALELKRGFAARRSAMRPCITVCIRGCGMCWRRSKCKPAGRSRAARNRHAARYVDHHADPVGGNVNRHSTGGHPAGATHAYGAVAFGARRNCWTLVHDRNPVNHISAIVRD